MIFCKKKKRVLIIYIVYMCIGCLNAESIFFLQFCSENFFLYFLLKIFFFLNLSLITQPINFLSFKLNKKSFGSTF